MIASLPFSYLGHNIWFLRDCIEELFESRVINFILERYCVRHQL